MRIIRAKNLGMCFGVRDAIGLALERAKQGPLTVFGELVHNETVLTALRQRGVQVEHDPGKVRTAEVMITAHGASERTVKKLQGFGLQVTEATCPLVHHAHQVLQRLVDEKYHPVIIGKRDHVEVRGLSEDLAECDVILSDADVLNVKERPRFGVVSQTTQPISRVQQLVNLLRRRFPNSEVRFEDTVCQPTKQRQIAAAELAQEVEVVVVVGGASSNNTRELVNTCRLFCTHVYHVQNSAELRPEWFDGVESVGLTAGTSTPDVTIEAVEHWLRRLAEMQSQVPQSLTLAASRELEQANHTVNAPSKAAALAA